MGLLDFIFPKYCVNCKKMGSYLCENCFSYLSFDVGSICLVCNKASFDGLTHKRCQARYTIDGSFSALAFKGVARKLVYQFKYKPFLTDLKAVLVDLFYEALIQKETLVKSIGGGGEREVRDVSGSGMRRKRERIREVCQDAGDEKCELASHPNSHFPTHFPPPCPHLPVLVPIPLHKSKLKKRGYNQSEILANELGKRFGFKILNLLERIKDTKTQVGLKREERRENIKGAFRIRGGDREVRSGSGSETAGKRGRASEACRGVGNVKCELSPHLNSHLSTHFSHPIPTTIFLIDDVLTTGSTLSEAAKVLKRAGARRVYGLTLAKD